MGGSTGTTPPPSGLAACRGASDAIMHHPDMSGALPSGTHAATAGGRDDPEGAPLTAPTVTRRRRRRLRAGRVFPVDALLLEETLPLLDPRRRRRSSASPRNVPAPASGTAARRLKGNATNPG